MFATWVVVGPMAGGLAEFVMKDGGCAQSGSSGAGAAPRAANLARRSHAWYQAQTTLTAATPSRLRMTGSMTTRGRTAGCPWACALIGRFAPVTVWLRAGRNPCQYPQRARRRTQPP